MIKFREWLEEKELFESIKPKEIKYGINSKFNNGQIYEVNSSFFITSFLYEDKIYFVLLNNGDISFLFMNKSRFEFEKYDYYDLLNILDQEDNTKITNTKNVLRVFNYVVYIVLEISKKYNIKNLHFYSQTPELDKVYSNMVKNKFFIEEFKKLGYVYTKNNKYYHFDKE
jgi:hypothetical protein